MEEQISKSKQANEVHTHFLGVRPIHAVLAPIFQRRFMRAFWINKSLCQKFAGIDDIYVMILYPEIQSRHFILM